MNYLNDYINELKVNYIKIKNQRMASSKIKDNDLSSNHSSEIVNYYKDKTIFITGATGFLGKVLIEKLLRSCYDIKKIYILVRSKKGASPAQRLDEIFSSKLFETVSQYYPDFKSKVAAVQGDLVEPNMGISDEDEQVLIDQVNVIFHSAATVRFDEPLK